MAQEQGKARSLIHKFVQFTPAEEELEWEYAKQCAIIHCKDIIENFGLLSDGKKFFTAYATIQFYQKALTEIEKL